MLISTCTHNFLEAGFIKLTIILISQIYQDKLSKKLLFFSSCFILFNYWMQDYYSKIFSLIALDIFICNWDVIPSLDLTAKVNINKPGDANLATMRVRFLSTRRKIRIMQDIRDILTARPHAANKLALLNNEQLGVLKNLCSEPTFNNVRAYKFAENIITREPFKENSITLEANTAARNNFIRNFDPRVDQYKNIRGNKPF